MQKKLSLWMLMLLALFVASACKKDKDEPTNNTSGSSEAVLMIQTPAQNLTPGEMLTYSAIIVKKDGTSEVASASWSTSNADVATFSGSTLTAKAEGDISVKAQVSYKGSTLEASVALGVKLPSVFAVAPSAIIWYVNADPIQLTPVYIGTQNPGNYTFTSSDATVASVSSSGLVSFLKAGFCVIEVKATGLSGQPTVTVPVQVVGIPAVELPIARIVVTPGKVDLFKNETQTFTAKAYDINGTEKSATFTWKVSNDTIASITSAGLLTAHKLGETYVIAEANGVVGQAEVTVNPSKIIELTPYVANIGAGKTRQFIAKTYQVTRNGSSFNLNLISNPTDLKWEIPTYGISILDIATVNQSGLVTMKSDATIGLASFVAAYSPSDDEIEPGVSIIMVSQCDCGSDNPSVASISTNQSSYSLSVTTNPTTSIVAQALNGTGGVVSGADIKFCSDAMSVVTVDDSGTLVAVGPGTATVTVCVGSITKTVSVNVSF